MGVTLNLGHDRTALIPALAGDGGCPVFIAMAASHGVRRPSAATGWRRIRRRTFEAWACLFTSDIDLL